MTDVNGNPNGTAAHANYIDEAIARLTQATESLAWDDLDLATQEDIMLTAFRPAEWLSRKGVIVGAVKKADDDEAWYHWKALARERGVDAYGYEKAVDAFLARAKRAGVPTSPETIAVPPPAPLDASLVTSVDLLNLTLPPKTPYLDWLSERSLAMVYGPRGVGKTLWLLELGISLSMPKSFLKWPVHPQVSVLYVDGEMALDSLQLRVRQLAGDHPPPGLHFLPSELVYARSARDLTLSVASDRLAIDAMLDTGAIKVLILDNVSCLFPGLDESKKQDWEPINAWLIRLRHRGITVIVGHHAGKNGQQRGTSGREDALDTIIALTLPPGHQAEDGCHLHLRFEKSRGVKGATVEALDVRLEEMHAGPVWTCAPLDARRKERIKTMLEDGMPAKLIADELGISASYIYRCKRELRL
jgi:hypothetical protein